MNWEPWSCTNDDCRAATWLAQRSAPQIDLWSVAADSDDRPFSVAAPAPICPRCGTTLEAAYTLEHDARLVLYAALAPALVVSGQPQ
jgi:hypothetical protein